MLGRASKPFSLRSLLHSPLITVVYDTGIEGESPEVIYRIPKNVTTYFSPVLKDCFPRPNQRHVNRPGCDGATLVTVDGSVKLAYVMLFQWMLDSCQANGKTRINYLPFSKYARLYEAAEILGVADVEKEMLTRMNKIANGQVPCEDVRMVYATYPKESVIRQIVIRSIGNAILNRTLRRWSLYLDFRVDCVEYDDDINEYIDVKRRERREIQQGKHEKNEKKNRRTHQNQDQQNVPGSVVNRQVSAPLARKGKGAQPSYYKVGLGDLGVARR